MIKTMVFIDGTWLHRSLSALRRVRGDDDYNLDYGKLPRALTLRLAQQIGLPQVDLVRTCLWGSFPSNYAAEDEAAVRAQLNFFGKLKEEHHYEVELYPIDFGGQRLRAKERTNQGFTPKEKCVDVALATSLVYLATVPYAYDVAICVTGDEDYVPALRQVRRLGKRVLIASVRASCDSAYFDPRDPRRVRDLETVFLDDMLDEVGRSPRSIVPSRTASQAYVGASSSSATGHLRQKEAGSLGHDGARLTNAASDAKPAFVEGLVVKVVRDRGFGFLRDGSGKEYFFHVSALCGLAWGQLAESSPVRFRINPADAGKVLVLEPLAKASAVTPTEASAMPAVISVELEAHQSAPAQSVN